MAIFPSLEGEALEEFSLRLAERWRVGRKGLDNGVILVMFVRERRVRLEIGYGLEAVIPDAAAGQIIREVIAPRFREGRYALGLEAAAGAVFTRISGRDASARRGPSGDGFGSGAVLGLLVVLVLIGAVLMQEAFSARRFVRRQGYTAGRGGRWSAPIIIPSSGWGGGHFGGGSGGDFSGGGGSFGGGGASGEW